MALHSREQLRKGSGISQASLFPAAKPLRQNVPWPSPQPAAAWEGSPDAGPTALGTGRVGPPPTWQQGGLARSLQSPG